MLRCATWRSATPSLPSSAPRGTWTLPTQRVRCGSRRRITRGGGGNARAAGGWSEDAHSRFTQAVKAHARNGRGARAGLMEQISLVVPPSVSAAGVAAHLEWLEASRAHADARRLTMDAWEREAARAVAAATAGFQVAAAEAVVGAAAAVAAEAQRAAATGAHRRLEEAQREKVGGRPRPPPLVPPRACVPHRVRRAGQGG